MYIAFPKTKIGGPHKVGTIDAIPISMFLFRGPKKDQLAMTVRRERSSAGAAGMKLLGIAKNHPVFNTVSIFIMHSDKNGIDHVWFQVTLRDARLTDAH